LLFLPKPSQERLFLIGKNVIRRGGGVRGDRANPNRKERQWAGERSAKSGKRAEKGYQKDDERKERVG
jgi:hypothetical protein